MAAFNGSVSVLASAYLCVLRSLSCQAVMMCVVISVHALRMCVRAHVCLGVR